jgi:hypothetical protein
VTPIGPEPHTVPDRKVYALAIGLLIAAVVLVAILRLGELIIQAAAAGT